MGNQAFEIPCADRKTREKNLLNKYDRTKIYEENKDKPPRSQRVLNGVENVIHNHERKTTKNSAFIERNLKTEYKKSTTPSERNTKEEYMKNFATEPLALTTLDSNDLDSMKVDFLSKPSIINELNKVLFAEKVNFLPTFVFPNPMDRFQTIIISQSVSSIEHIEINGDERYEYEERRIKLKDDINQGYLELKKFLNLIETNNSEYIGYHHNPKDKSEYVLIFLRAGKRESESERSKDSLNETHFEMQSLMFENLNSQDIMAKINDRAKNKLVFKGLINLIGGNDTGKKMCILLFGKTKSEEVMEYFLNRISADDEEEENTPRVVINAEICRKIQSSCDADALTLFGFIPLLEEKLLYFILGKPRDNE